MRFPKILFAVVALAGCGSGSEPKGQVVATVDGVEITQSELNAEIGGRKAQTPAQQKQLQQAVLDQMIARVLLANAAVEKGLDKTPEAAIAKHRAEQMVLINLLEKNLGSSTPKISPEEVSQFIAENPEMFSARRIYLVDQIAVASPTEKLLKALQPLNTVDEVKAELARNNIATGMAMGVVDGMTLPPAAAKQLAALPADAVFIMPAQGGIRINHIRETQISPVTGEGANGAATAMLTQARTGQQVQNSVGKILQDGRSKVQYNPAFKPAPAIKGKAPAVSGAAK